MNVVLLCQILTIVSHVSFIRGPGYRLSIWLYNSLASIRIVDKLARNDTREHRRKSQVECSVMNICPAIAGRGPASVAQTTQNFLPK